MAITKSDVEKVAQLARLSLSGEEKEKYTVQLGNILEFVEKLKELDTSDVPPTAHPFSTETVWREDVAQPWKESREILKNSPDQEESFFKVNKVLE